jgi:hypothetical protein
MHKVIVTCCVLVVGLQYFHIVQYRIKNRDSSVGIALGYGLGGHGTRV